MASNKNDVQIDSVAVNYLPVEMRMPLKFGAESVSSVTCIRVAVTVTGIEGRMATGWGETPLSVTWAWPSATLTYQQRYDAMIEFCRILARGWVESEFSGHPMEIGHAFIENVMPELLDKFNADREEHLPHLAALIAVSAFDLATHDAYGVFHDVDVYATYNDSYMSHDLSHYLTSERDDVDFTGKFPDDFLVEVAPDYLPVWHLVGGLDPLEKSDCKGDEPSDGYPVVLREWIERDGLTCLKIKLRGTDSDWDYERLIKIGDMSLQLGVTSLSADFNCTVTDPQYVNDILDQLKAARPEIFDMVLYVEQPFPYDLENNQIDVSSVAQRKSLFLDESAHDWKFVQLGQKLGWSGVALKTCKTQTGALLSLCWAKAHGMPLMVQDLTNPMLAQIPHVRLAAHAGTIMGVESNGMQFYPAASIAEETVHPGIYRRSNGMLDLSTISGPGFGYRVSEVERELPEPEVFSTPLA
ncbi:MAG: enolase C-terminal domain-like protein [Rubripirellula sp.]|jgi:L-alanine-DL-glutamate epimerase-like enolase superfamily enzyme